jgi:coproporphyrinogen III oxidase-like Fe-S oxidoreductase
LRAARVAPVTLEPPHLTLDGNRPLIIGIIPHTACNPRVEGCGFCTFPHDSYDKQQIRYVVGRVEQELESLLDDYPELARRRVDAVYFGGATANLTPPAVLGALARTLAGRVSLADAEVTLEGVPSLFLSLLGGHLEMLERLPVRHRRISMGMQTFDRAQLKRMGRQGFGDAKTVAQVVERAHRRGMTVSADLLVNLPGQTPAAMLEDIRLADELGLDQICVYHLVLRAGLEVPWARDPELLAALPATEQACENWLAVRAALVERGFVQTTLTNFERAEVAGTARRFVYEEASFSPATWDALGIGPRSISTFVNLAERRAVKLVRGHRAGAAVGGKFSGDDLYFPYDEEDLRLLFVTRSLPRLSLDRALYQRSLGGDLVAHFAEPLAALRAAGLVTIDDSVVTLTPRGMFYADTVAGLLAWRRVEAVRPAAAGRHSVEAPEPSDFMG